MRNTCLNSVNYCIPRRKITQDHVRWQIVSIQGCIVVRRKFSYTFRGSQVAIVAYAPEAPLVKENRAIQIVLRIKVDRYR